MNDQTMQAAISRMRQVQLRLEGDGYPGDAKTSIGAQAEVLDRFQPLFAQSNLERLTETDFRAFLMFRNNRHWRHLHRQGPKICGDMPTLRRALAILQDERRPIAERFDYLDDHIHGMGRAIITAVLLILFPTQYGVWNRLSEEGLESLAVLPKKKRGESMGARYTSINLLLLELSRGLDVDLWTLDSLWFYLSEDEKARNSDN